MTYDFTAGPSGSRWEPMAASAPTADLPTPPVDASAVPPAGSAEPRRERRRRRPIVAFLIAILTLGASSAGIAWARTQDHTVVDPTSSTSGAPFAGGGSGPDGARGLGPDGDGDGTRPFGNHGRDGGRFGDDQPAPGQGSGDQGSGDQAPAQPGATT